MLKRGSGNFSFTTDVALRASSMRRVPRVVGGDGARLVLGVGKAAVAGMPTRTIGAVRGVLEHLGEPEKMIVCMRYGIGMRLHSVDEISEQLGVQPSQIERIELRAFRKLRDSAVVKGSDRPAGSLIPFHNGKRPPAPPTEPPNVPEDSGRDKNSWDEV